MTELRVNDYLPILTTGLWVGVFITFVSKMLAYVIEVIIRWFKRI